MVLTQRGFEESQADGVGVLAFVGGQVEADGVVGSEVVEHIAAEGLFCYHYCYLKYICQGKSRPIKSNQG